MATVTDNSLWPYMVKYLDAAFDWAEKAPEGAKEYLGMHIGRIEVCIEGELIGYIHTGDELHFEPVES
jgi:hypothetical protein